jgi:hypothetical protein
LKTHGVLKDSAEREPGVDSIDHSNDLQRIKPMRSSKGIFDERFTYKGIELARCRPWKIADERLRRFIAGAGKCRPTCNQLTDTVAMLIACLASATSTMKRRRLLLLSLARRLVNRWVAAAIAYRVKQLRHARPRARHPDVSFAVSVRQASVDFHV